MQNKWKIQRAIAKFREFSSDKILRTNLKRPYYKAGASVATDKK